MKKFMSKLYDVLANITCYSLIGAFTLASVGAFIWSAKWVLKLLEVM